MWVLGSELFSSAIAASTPNSEPSPTWLKSYPPPSPYQHLLGPGAPLWTFSESHPLLILFTFLGFHYCSLVLVPSRLHWPSVVLPSFSWHSSDGNLYVALRPSPKMSTSLSPEWITCNRVKDLEMSRLFWIIRMCPVYQVGSLEEESKGSIMMQQYSQKNEADGRV